MNGVAVSIDGSPIKYLSVGDGPGLIVVGGSLSTAESYLPLARRLAAAFTVHVIERRGRPDGGPLGPGHDIEQECADLAAVATATGARTAFGHSFGGLVVLEAARRQRLFDRVVVYEPGVPLRGNLDLRWLDGYQRLLVRGDRRGAFALMVKEHGFAPVPLRMLPLPLVKVILRLAFPSRRWSTIDRLLEANLSEHRILAALDAPDLSRFTPITVPTLLLGGEKSPGALTLQVLDDLATVISDPTVEILPGLTHLAPEDDPGPVAAAILSTVGCYALSSSPGERSSCDSERNSVSPSGP